MDFLKRNSGKIALLALIAFFTLPFIYGNEEEEDFSPFAVRSGMSYQTNPISKLANRIASFYGFSKPSSVTVASAKTTNSIKDKVADHHTFHKENVAKAKSKTQGNTLLASSRNFKNFDVDGADTGLADSKSSASVRNSSGSSFGNSYNAYHASNSNNPVKGYVNVNGKDYAVIEDATGERYVVTPKGHIAYRDLVKRTISDSEFLEAKKRLAGASDTEVLSRLQQEKLAAAGGRNYQEGVTNYRNGTATNMGGTNYARVSTGDKGFDDNILSDAYADLKNINLKVASSSIGGGRSGGNYYSKGSTNEQSVEEEVFNPANIATQARTAVQQNARQDITGKNLNDMQARQRGAKTKGNSSADNSTESNDVSLSTMLPVNMASMPEIQYLTVKDGEYKLANKPSAVGEILFVADVKNSDMYSDWGKIELSDGNISGRILPQVTGNKVKIPNLENNPDIKINYNEMEQNINSINSSIDTIKNEIEKLPPDVKVYVNLEECDEPSKKLIKNIMKVNIPDEGEISILTDKPKGENVISLPNFILTPTYFKNGAQELLRQARNFQAENMPA